MGPHESHHTRHASINSLEHSALARRIIHGLVTAVSRWKRDGGRRSFSFYRFAIFGPPAPPVFQRFGVWLSWTTGSFCSRLCSCSLILTLYLPAPCLLPPSSPVEASEACGASVSLLGCLLLSRSPLLPSLFFLRGHLIVPSPFFSSPWSEAFVVRLLLGYGFVVPFLRPSALCLCVLKCFQSDFMRC